jgi:hypothetical protein
MYKPSTYLVITVFLTQLPIYETSLLSILLSIYLYMRPICYLLSYLSTYVRPISYRIDYQGETIY